LLRVEQSKNNYPSQERSVVRSTYNILQLAKAVIYNRYILYILSTFGFIYIWDFVAAMGFSKFLPRPIEVVNQLIYMLQYPLAGKTLLAHVWFSIKRVLIGFAIAVVSGIPIGLAIGLNRYVRAIVKPIFDLFKPMPPIAWISLAILWFGIGETSKVFIIYIGSIVPCVINSYNALYIIDPELYDAAKMLGANRRQEFFHVTLPGAFPAIFAGIQISLSMAWTTVIAAELVGAREGIGFIIIQGMNLARPAQIIGGMIVIAVTAWLISATFNRIERWVCPWKAEVAQQ